MTHDDAVRRQAVAEIHAWAADPRQQSGGEPPRAVRLLAEYAMDAGAADWAARLGMDVIAQREAGASDHDLVKAVLAMVCARMAVDWPETEWFR